MTLECPVLNAMPQYTSLASSCQLRSTCTRQSRELLLDCARSGVEVECTCLYRFVERAYSDGIVVLAQNHSDVTRHSRYPSSLEVTSKPSRRTVLPVSLSLRLLRGPHPRVHLQHERDRPLPETHLGSTAGSHRHSRRGSAEWTRQAVGRRRGMCSREHQPCTQDQSTLLIVSRTMSGMRRS